MNVEVSITVVVLFVLASLRIIAALWVAPVFSHTAIPMRVRGMFAIVVAAASIDEWSGGSVALSTAPLALAAMRELLIGIALGTALSLVFSGIALMGEFASIQGGLGAAAVVDPSSGANSLAVATIGQSFVLLAFLALDGHHFVLRAIFGSFEWAPVGGAAFPMANFGALAGAGSIIFDVAVRFAAPITAVMLVMNTAVGILGRSVPQLNLMSVQLPAQIMLLLLILVVAAAPWIEAAVGAAFEQSERALMAFAGAR